MEKFPIGVSDFEEIVKGGYYYVDKTMLIKDIIELPGKVKLITRPRRFGKIRRFFSIKDVKEVSWRGGEALLGRENSTTPGA